MKKPTTSPLTAAEFETLYWANRAAADNPSAEVAYWRTEAAVFARCGRRMYASYNSFKVVASRRAEKKRTQADPIATDPKQLLTTIISVVNTYICRIDLPFLVRYHSDVSRRLTDMEVFGPANGTYNAEEHRLLKTTAGQLSALIQYIQNMK